MLVLVTSDNHLCKLSICVCLCAFLCVIVFVSLSVRVSLWLCCCMFMSVCFCVRQRSFVKVAHGFCCRKGLYPFVLRPSCHHRFHGEASVPMFVTSSKTPLALHALDQASGHSFLLGLVIFACATCTCPCALREYDSAVTGHQDVRK